jgi:transcriptional regulator with PAS, ATPase and Fis domain
MIELYVIEKKKPITKEIEIRRLNKKIRVTSHPIFRQDGQLWYIVSCAREIKLSQTPREQTDQNNQNSNDHELLEKNQFMKGIIAKSQAMRNVVNKAKHVAAVDTNVLILGETGVGKEVVTEIIHKMSSRRKGPLVKINCGAIPETLLESELFGYEKGSFTGANTKGKVGLLARKY